MNLFVDTSVWSLAFRRDAASGVAEVDELQRALQAGDQLVTTGIVLQELLQGFSGAKARTQIIEQFAALPLLMPDRQDHVDAAELRNHCRRHGVQVGTIDALLSQLCIRYKLVMLSTDRDFDHMTKVTTLKIWSK